MRIGVLGAGAMGSAFAGMLTDAGEDVTLIARSRLHIAAIAAGGLRIDRPDGTTLIAAPRATAEPALLPVGSLDAIVVMTKAFDTAGAMRSVAHALGPEGIAVSLQNGLGNEVPIAEAVGAGRTLVGVTTVGARLHEPGRVTITSTTADGTSTTQFGPPDPVSVHPTAMAVASDLARRCTRAGLPSVARTGIEVDIWNKLALAVMGPVSAVLQRSVARVWEHAVAQRLLRSMFDEVVDVASASGVPLDRNASWAHATRTYEGTGDHHTSMCTDVMLGRRTEIEAMAGAVANRGTALGVATPVHDTIVALVRTLEGCYPPR